MINRDELLAKIEIRMEEVFGDDLVFEVFLTVEQKCSDKYLLWLSTCDDSKLQEFAKHDLRM
jgi:hypothetical protein